MSVSPSQPTRRLRGASFLASTAWWLAVAAWLFLVVTWVALHGVIVPRIEKLRPWVEEQASERLGLSVRIGHLAARADSWRHLPTIEMSDIRIRNAQGRETLSVSRVQATLSPRSLWRLGFEQLVVDRPRLDAVRRADGRFEIAGVVLDRSDNGGSLGRDWFFSQRDVIVREGAVHWRDERPPATGGQPRAPATVEGIALVVRNHGLRHDVRIDARLPEGWGGRLHAAAQMRQPLLSLHRGRWEDWQGELFAEVDRVDFGQLAPYLSDWPGPMRLDAGTGRVRMWSRLDHAALDNATLDVDLRDVVARRVPGGAVVASAPEAAVLPLALAELSGRLSWRDLPRGFAVETQDLAFRLADGPRWPGGNASVRYQAAGSLAPEQGRVTGRQLDLAALAQVAERLPLDETVRQRIAALAPQGLVRQLEAQWSGRMGPSSREGSQEQVLRRNAAPAATGESPWEPMNWQLHASVEGLALAPGQPRPRSQAPVRAGGTGAGSVDSSGKRPIERPLPGRPGIRGADAVLDLNQDGGTARVTVRQGELVFPGVFEQPAMPMDTLDAQVRWRRVGAEHSVEVSDLQFANADAAGFATGTWRTGGTAEDRLPGHLTLKGELTRANGTRVHRYLPVAIPELTRHYVRDAVRGGRATRTTFAVDSGLDHFPPRHAQEGVFRIVADLDDVDFDYVPESVAERTHQPVRWPALAGLDAQLVFDRIDMDVRGARGRFADYPQLKVAETSARIAGLGQAEPVLEINGRVDGPMAQALGYVQHSPLDALAGGAFARSQATGDAAIQLGLRIPLHDASATTVLGTTQIQQADLRLTPEAPVLAQTQARVDFTEHGFKVSNARTRLLGGELQFSGQGEQEGRPETGAGSNVNSAGSSPARAAETTPSAPRRRLAVQFEGQGTLTADGLVHAHELPLLAQIGSQLEGQTRYGARVTVAGGQLMARFDSDLQGLASNLPAPFAKTAETALPVRFEASPTGTQQDRVAFQLGERIKAVFERDLSASYPRVRRGAIQIDEHQAPEAVLPASGVDLGLKLDTVDVSAWQALLTAPGPDDDASPGALPSTAAGMASAALRAHAAAGPADGESRGRSEAQDNGSPHSAHAAALASFLPTRIDVQARELRFSNRAIHNLRASGTHRQGTWSADVSADEVQGQLRYSQGAGEQPGQLFARLDRLVLDRAAGPPARGTGRSADALDELLDRETRVLPGLDIEVGALRLSGLDLGRLRVRASNLDAGEVAGSGNRTRVWRLDTLTLSVPEATLSATGQWRLTDGRQATGDGAGEDAVRQTRLDFHLDTHDAGQLLSRFGYADLFRHGEGSLKGHVDWKGSPLAIDLASLDGALALDMRRGQFLKADPGPARLLGVLSLQALPRRLVLDFRDAFSEGFAFDFLRGDVRIDQGKAVTNNLQMKGVSAGVLMEGQADLVRETQDLRVVVVPELNTTSMALIATAINPVVGLGTFIAQLVLRRPLLQSVTRTFHIHGSWTDPQIEAVQNAPGTPSAEPPSQPAQPADEATRFPEPEIQR